jgi:DNA-binding PadR family transcriptional regulator
MRGDVLKGQLDALVLAALRDGPLHGYAVIETLRELSEGSFDLAEGTIYPVLHRLEAEGHLTSSWSTVGGRRRRVYRLSRGGRAALERKRGEWRSFAHAMDSVLA